MTPVDGLLIGFTGGVLVTFLAYLTLVVLHD